MRTFLHIAIWTVALWAIGAFQARAAYLDIVPERISEKTVSAKIILDTEGMSLNTLALRLEFEPRDLQVVGVRDGNSAIGAWIERPEFSNETGEILLTGIIPGGASGRVQVLEIIFEPWRTGEVYLEIAEFSALLNDGSGTPARTSGSRLSFRPDEAEMRPEPADFTAPDSFSPQLGQSPEVFESKHFLVFETKDKDSGMSHYEVLEIRSARRTEIRGWERAVSPYVLKDQSLQSDIYVRAVDVRGNFRIEKVAAKNPSGRGFWGAPSRRTIYVFCVIIALCALSVLWWRRKKRWSLN